MRPSLSKWVSDADALRHLEEFRVSQTALQLAYIPERLDDYYTSLVLQQKGITHLPILA